MIFSNYTVNSRDFQFDEVKIRLERIASIFESVLSKVAYFDFEISNEHLRINSVLFHPVEPDSTYRLRLKYWLSLCSIIKWTTE